MRTNEQKAEAKGRSVLTYLLFSYGKKAPCRASTDAGGMAGGLVASLLWKHALQSSASATVVLVHRPPKHRAARGGGRVQGLNSIVSSRSQLEHGHLWTWRCTEQLWTLAELPSAEWQSMTSCLALCRELITHARRTRWVKICITGVSSEVCVQSAKGDHAATPRTAAPAAREDTGSATAIGARCGASIALVH